MNDRLTAGLNGFGRFGLNFLWWWFSDKGFPYRIAYINDEILSPKEILAIIRTDPLVSGFRGLKVTLSGSVLVLQEQNGRTERIMLTHGLAENAPWLGKPDIFLECSGKRATASQEMCEPFLAENTKVVIVSATSHDADKTLIMGFNHENFQLGEDRIVSYGSCTVNPGVTLAAAFNESFGVDGCTVNVIHNVQQRHLDSGDFRTLQRKGCTLESVAPQFLSFLTKDNFLVRYTVVPYGGPSMIDFSFQLDHVPTRVELVGTLKNVIGVGGTLNGLFGMVPTDTGPEAHICSPYSAVIVESGIRMVGDTAHIPCYFYNEGSGSRMHELASYIVGQI